MLPSRRPRRGREAVVVLSEASYRALREGARVGTPGFAAQLLAIPKGDEMDGKASCIALRDVEL